MSEDVTDTELHWVAGLLEGEGSFLPGPPSSPRLPIISVHMTDEDVVARLGRIFGRKVYVGKPRNPRWRTSYMLRVTGGKAVRWMVLLRPLMGTRRQAQIDRALASYAPRPRAILTDETAAAALAALEAGETVKAVAARLGVSVWCIYDLRLGRTHKHLRESRRSGALTAIRLDRPRPVARVYHPP
jgi:hypothetical protein